jgi:signal transduction histidine kinase
VEVRRVIIIDDNPRDSEAARRSLQADTRRRYRFREFGYGREAIDYLTGPEVEADLVILDWRLPDLTAPEVLTILRGEEPITAVPVVVLTGSNPVHHQDPLSIGAQDYFEKSQLTLGLLPRIATNAIERHNLLRRLVESEKAAAEAERSAAFANRAKSTFLANMSHELRTPLTAIIGLTELLLDRDLDPDGRQMLELVRTSSRHLAELIGDILDLTKIEAGTLDLHPVACSPAQLVQELCQVMRYRAADKHLALDLSFQQMPGRVRTDPTRLRQIVLNLVSNAIKFTEQGSVRVEMGWASDRLHLAVSDTGPGIAAEQQEQIFERFIQIDRDPRHGGVGLGLPISRSLARLMGGDLTVTSRNGGGCTFDLVISAPIETGGTSLNPPAAAPPLPSPVDGYNWRQRRILVAEDTTANQFLIRSLLRSTGASVECADNGAIALTRVGEASRKGQPFDVILMDMQMPVMDGFEAVAALRGDGCHIPIIAITAGAAAGDKARCLASGCNGYIAKPFGRDSLLQTIDHAFAS